MRSFEGIFELDGNIRQKRLRAAEENRSPKDKVLEKAEEKFPGVVKTIGQAGKIGQKIVDRDWQKDVEVNKMREEYRRGGQTYDDTRKFFTHIAYT